MKALTIAATALSLLAGCQESNSSSILNNSNDEVKAPLQWVDSASRALLGENLQFQDMAKYAGLPREEIVDRMMDDPRFLDTVTEFTLIYYGRRPSSLKSTMNGENPNGTPFVQYDEKIFSVPQSLAVAQAVGNNGDFFTIFDIDSPVYLEPTQLVNQESRESGIEEFKTTMDDIKFSVAEGFSSPCSGHSSFQVQSRLAAMGIPDHAIDNIRFNWFNWIEDTYCERPDASVAMVTEAYNEFQNQIIEMVNSLPDSEATNLTSLRDMIPITLSETSILPPLNSSLSTEGFWKYLPGSSTNYNRKRAAYMLRTFFCDDLVPIEIVEASDEEAPGGAHATNPGCQACHYKLDPIGGLFRNHGKDGTYFPEDMTLVFDDEGTVEPEKREDYLKTWHNKDGVIDVGYFTSPGKKHPMWPEEGTDLESFFEFAKNSDEIKQCLVRRIGEYFLGEEQTIDGAWLEALLKDLPEDQKFEPGPTSSAGFKSIIKKILLGKTFEQQSPDPNVCYDSLESDNENRPDCRVSHILNTKCVSCHSGVDPTKESSLDLSRWQENSKGELTFPHMRNGVEVERTETLDAVMKSITVGVPMEGPGGEIVNTRMPLAQEPLPTLELTELMEWLQSKLEDN